ncbi:unnamed protein product [Auanema sp. JU1783]|nr:unnamed protein product [Auanema sp. JU1783]
MLKHMYRSEKRSKKIQIIHPFDHFSSPPIITNESVASIKANLAKSDFHDENYKNNYENDHLDINELERCQTNSTEFLNTFIFVTFCCICYRIYLTPSVLDSLPDPPSISIKDLQRTIQMNDRKERIQLPQPIPRWSSTTREATYAVPPPPPAHATSLYHKPQTLTSSIHSPVSNASSIISSSSLNGLAMIDDEIEFNTLDKPLSQHIAHELRKKFRNINQSFDNREIEF